MNIECYFCHQKTVQKLVEKFNPSPEVAEEFVYAVHQLLGDKRTVNNPELACHIHRAARTILQVDDLYAEEKLKANQLLLSQYDYWRALIDRSEDPFAVAAKLAVIGNIIDYGAHSVGADIVVQIQDLLKSDLAIDHTAALKTALAKAEKVVYLGDNAGEIFFDRLFLETIKHPNVYFVTRGYPVINDITRADARMMELERWTTVIDNGSDAPSTLLKSCSEEFLEVYRNADLIISKGQGNFEGLMNEKHPNTFFMLIAKCEPIARMLDVEVKSKIITNKIEHEF